MPSNLVIKLIQDNQHAVKFSMKHLDNLVNPEMNNLMSIDHANRDWLDNADGLVPMFGAEFPRLSENYTSKHSNGIKMK